MQLLSELIILHEEQLEEGRVKRVLAGAVMAAGLHLSPIATDDINNTAAAIAAQLHLNNDAEVKWLAKNILARYQHADEEFILDVIQLAKKHAAPGNKFPTAKDILSVIGVEQF